MILVVIFGDGLLRHHQASECHAVHVRTLCGSVRYTRMDATTSPPREKVRGAAGSQDRLSHICDMRYAKKKEMATTGGDSQSMPTLRL